MASAPRTAHSSAADEDRPDPIGTSLVTDMAPPGNRWPAARTAHTTPATYAAQPVTSPGTLSRAMRTGPSARSLTTLIASPPVGVNVTSVRCGRAIGRANPRL
ncbi:hypothetical protein BN971_04907 [Mycobacterium bohemicum DSM 44277]|uniref:Uncharacterized protein n=1 Tax=Mycobacterium bohemicum DSM 44277 TaxID=1236609 RepID=A0A0U0WGZ4_MYCBE|nr:hypothetical protein BN971_04907 [Mycobacterium bohemicum DSM 44277]